MNNNNFNSTEFEGIKNQAGSNKFLPQQVGICNNEFYQKANLQLKNLGIKAKLKPEFWHNQWEYESDFQIGNTAQTIESYKKFLENIEAIFAPQIPKIQPINYDWQKVKDLTIHIPNSTQINISLWNQENFLVRTKNNRALIYFYLTKFFHCGFISS